MTRTRVKIFWPTIKPDDTQCNLYSHVYNEEDCKFQANILWASTRPASDPKWKEKLFIANHFTILANDALVINRLLPIESRDTASDDIISEDVTEDTTQFDFGNNKDESSQGKSNEFEQHWGEQESENDKKHASFNEEKVFEEAKVSLKYAPTGLMSNEEIEIEEAKDSVQEQDLFEEERDPLQDPEREKMEQEPNQSEEEMDPSQNSENEQMELVPDHLYRISQFRDWFVLYKIANEVNPIDVHPDMKNLTNVDKNGQLYVVNCKENVEKHRSGGKLTHRDFEGQWNGKKTKSNPEVYTRKGPGEQFYQDNDNYKYIMDERKILDRKTYQFVTPEFYLNAMVMLRHKAYHGKDVTYRRCISYFLHVPYDLNQELLKRCTYEYIGTHPGFKPHGNRKVSFTFMGSISFTKFVASSSNIEVVRQIAPNVFQNENNVAQFLPI